MCNVTLAVFCRLKSEKTAKNPQKHLTFLEKCLILQIETK